MLVKHQTHGTCQLCLRMTGVVAVPFRFLRIKPLSTNATIMVSLAAYHQKHELFGPSLDIK